MNNIKYKLFDKSIGFGEHKDIAIELLDKLIKILDKHNIQYFLISGTLLGYVRHNDFIPWDDDMDIIVSEDFVKKYDIIVNSDDKDINFLATTPDYIYKFFFTNKVFCPDNMKYNWPFIDIFVYRESDVNINFFNKDWDKMHFFPAQKVLFNNIATLIPSNSDYFLSLNYGKDYMKIYISPSWNHKTEKHHFIRDISIKAKKLIKIEKKQKKNSKK